MTKRRIISQIGDALYMIKIEDKEIRYLATPIFYEVDKRYYYNMSTKKEVKCSLLDKFIKTKEKEFLI